LRDERGLKAIRLPAPVDVAAHRHEEEQDVGEGQDLDGEQEPDPAEGKALLRVHRQDRVGEAPQDVAQRDREHDGAGDGLRPGAVTRPVQGEDEEEGGDQEEGPEGL
jgi:hypothetical protein